jgi:glycosyltransferase involved in cell wall biosynthesis
MHLLYISSAVPPFHDSATIRTVFLLRGMARRGIQVTTISPDFPGGDASLLARMPDDVHSLRTPAPQYYLTHDRLHGRMRWLYANAMHYLKVPDVLAGWERQAVAAAEPVIRSRRPDLLYSSSGSVTAHLAASVLARTHRIPWIADVTDPWSLVERRAVAVPFQRWRNRRMERRTLAAASTLLFTTEECAAAYRDAWGKHLPPAHVIPCGYDREEFREERRILRDGAMRLTYVGVAYGGNRNLDPAIEAVARWNQAAGSTRIQMQVVGPHSAKFETGARQLAADGITFSDRVPYERSLDHIRQAHALFLIGNDGPLQVPGKVFMYLASGRPILYVGQLPKASDPTYKLLRDMPGVAFAEQSSASILERLQELDEQYENWERLALPRRRMPQVEQYEWDRLAGEVVRIAERLIT